MDGFERKISSRPPNNVMVRHILGSLFYSQYEPIRICIILAVAHRLDTLIDNDNVLVLGKGRVLEYGLPLELIMKGGAFCRMVMAKAQAKYCFDQGTGKKARY